MLVSVVLPTHVRRQWLIDAINCYLSQDWKEKELVVIDEGQCRDLFEVVPKSELVYFHDQPLTHNLSMKLNIACAIARGDVIVHFFSDDWSAPERVSHQVNALLDSCGEVGGYHSAYFWDENRKQASCYIGSKNYSWGAALCYRKDFAKQYPWPEDVNSAEDNEFIKPAQKKNSIHPVDGRGYIVARIHGASTQKSPGGSSWPLVPLEELPLAFRRIIENV